MVNNDAMVTMPPDVVRIRASSTVFVKASRRVNRDLAGILLVGLLPALLQKKAGLQSNVQRNRSKKLRIKSERCVPHPSELRHPL